ncbi:MAG TPA: PQQ-dependent sugar dehydrogenase [Planctomycetota bacterium]|nr:PQQ-dependent sugar dehydrogenase [Planctomycetota bacterium]
MRQHLAAALLVSCLAPLALGQTPLTTELVASGAVRPLWAGQPPGDTSRLFVVEQWQGDIEIYQLPSGVKNATPFLDLTGKSSAGGNERGLLGLAFDDDYANTGFLWVYYTRASDGAIIVERYTCPDQVNDPDHANPASGVVVLGPIAHPVSNHNGGNVIVGPDGKLWIGTGDGGDANDTGPNHHEPGGNAQWDLTLLGKMLRINKDGSIPADNPFVGNPNVLPQIRDKGLRNPWRFSHDRDTGDLWIADVGQNQREEIDFRSATSPAGANFGWRCMEGFLCTGLTGCVCNDLALTNPIQTYAHNLGKCSITGGFVYRGNAIPDLSGAYFYGDYCTAQIWSLRYNGVAVSELTERTVELDPPGATAIQLITSFGQGADGEIYVVDQNGEIFRIKPAGPFTGLGNALAGTSGKPILHGEGTLVAGTPGSVELTNAMPSAAAYLFVSLGVGGVPFKGGTLMPVPTLLLLPLASSPTGTLNLSWASWQAGVPGGTVLCFQYAIQDAGALNGVALSNALKAVTP